MNRSDTSVLFAPTLENGLPLELGSNMTPSLAPSMDTQFPHSDPWFLSAPHFQENHKTLESLFLAVIPILLLLCTIGSSLTIAIMVRQAQTMSAAIYFIALAVADVIFLYSHALGVLVQYLGLYWFRSGPGCAANQMMTTVGRGVSSVAIVLVTVERCLILYKPTKFMLFSRPPFAAGLCIIATILFLFSQIPQFWAWSYSEDLGCFIDTDANPNREGYVIRNSWAVYTFANFIPFLIGLVCSLILAIHLFRKQKELKRDPVQRHKMSCTSKRINRINVIVLALSVTFIIFSLPFTISDVFVLRSRHLQTYQTELAHSFALALTYCFHATHILTYSIISPTFRKKAHEMCRNACSAVLFCDRYAKERKQQASLRSGQWPIDRNILKGGTLEKNTL